MLRNRLDFVISYATVNFQKVALVSMPADMPQ